MHYRRWRIHGDTETTLKAANGDGYLQGGYPGHQVDGVRVFDHVKVAERALGKPLPPGAVVHHVNEIKTDCRPENLVICPDKAYHNLIHARMRALDACGDANKRACRYCKEYDSLENMRVYGNGASTAYWHTQCNRDAAKATYYANRGPLKVGVLEFGGERGTYAFWSQKTGIKSSTISMRINKYGWSLDRALTEGAKNER